MTTANPNPEKTPAPKIAIPLPHSLDREYAGRAIPQYEHAVRAAGGDPIRFDPGLFELELSPSELEERLEQCDAVLLPGSKADVDPAEYGASRHEKTAESDVARAALDRFLLDDAYASRKPVLGICYGLQSLNVYCAGTLVQHIESPVNHGAGRAVRRAHMVEIERGSRLKEILAPASGDLQVIAVNSSHHQSADAIGTDLKIVARCLEDGVIEAIEGTDPEHFVIAVQWHPERSVNDGPEVSETAKAIFRAFIEAARAHNLERARLSQSTTR
jgi:putative glutamine amidotransferase